jgi:hypothetical protein
MCFGILSTILSEAHDLWNVFLISLGDLLEHLGL